MSRPAPSNTCDSDSPHRVPLAKSGPIRLDTAPGELLDKLTILAIKLARIHDPGKRTNVALEHGMLDATARAALPSSGPLAVLTTALRAVNEALWDIEDAIRDCERAGNFGPAFVELARAVYKTNDRRAAIKKEINTLLGSQLVEEKSYAEY